MTVFKLNLNSFLTKKTTYLLYLGSVIKEHHEKNYHFNYLPFRNYTD